MLPAHPSPKQGELFQSWLARLAKANLCEPIIFSRMYLPKIDVWTGCINGDSKHDVFHTLSALTGIPSELLSSLRTAEYTKTHFIEPEGMLGRRHLLAGQGRSYVYKGKWLQYCPACLNEDKTPYFRNQWRVTALPICVQHKCLLYDACHHCGTPVNFHRLPLASESIATCPNCFAEYVNAPLVFISESNPLYYFSQLVSYGLETGYVKLSNDITLFMPVFLSGIWSLANPFFRRKTATKTRVYFSREYEKYSDSNSQGLGPFRINTLNVGQRASLFSCLGEMLMQWPSNFIRIVNTIGLSHVSFSSTTRSFPFWLDTVICSYFKRQPYWVSDAEFMNAARYLHKHHYKVTYANVSEVAGLSRSSERTPARDKILSEFDSDEGYYFVFHWP